MTELTEAQPPNFENSPATKSVLETPSRTQFPATEPPGSQKLTKPRGPRTKVGKQKASRNSLKHGLFSKVILLPDESRFEYRKLLAELREDRQPVGALEDILVEKLATAAWRQRRLLSEERAEMQKNGPDQQAIAQFFGERVPDASGLDRLLRYEAGLERFFDRALSQLDKVQRTRRGQPVLPEMNVRVSKDS